MIALLGYDIEFSGLDLRSLGSRKTVSQGTVTSEVRVATESA